jgi:molybdate transport system substrate-binding protein
MTAILRRSAVAAAAASAALLALTACSSGASTAAPSPSAPVASASSASATSAAGAVTGKLTVFAAASLKNTFTRFGKEFEAAHPGVTVTFNFGGSDTLAASIVSGAPADVFASASTATMATVTKASDNAAAPANFARNSLEIAVVPGNPKHITTIDQLAAKSTKVALCAKTVPCGAAAVKALAAAKVSVTPVTYEQDVTSALTKVELKEVDAALVYRTDVQGAKGKVVGVDFPAAAQAVTSYPIAPLTHSGNSAAAQAFTAFILSAPVQAELAAAGFQAP